MHRPGPALYVGDKENLKELLPSGPKMVPAACPPKQVEGGETVKTANENELIDKLKVVEKANDTNLTEEAHSRSSGQTVFRGETSCNGS